MFSFRFSNLTHRGIITSGPYRFTKHPSYVSKNIAWSFVSQAIGQLSLDTGIPIAFGLLTCNTFEQAHERSGGKVGNKGHEATLAMLEMVHLSDQLDQL